MALWQVGFFILPKEILKYHDAFKTSEENDFDDFEYWQLFNVPLSVFEPIDSFLPQSTSWAKYITLYGSENSNRLEIVSENNIIKSVDFRIDFTSNYTFILEGIVEFCIHNGFIIIDENLNIVPLNVETISTVIKNSEQYLKYYDLMKNQDKY